MKDLFSDEKKPSANVVISGKSMLEKSSYAMAATILLVVVIVMTTDIKFNFVQNAVETSATFFVLMFLSYGMYINMYSSGIFSGEKTEEYTSMLKAYTDLRKSLTVENLQQRLTKFCQQYVECEWKARCVSVLSTAGVTWEKFLVLRDYDKAKMTAENISPYAIAAVIKARKIKPIKLTPEMVYKEITSSIRRRGMRMQPNTRRLFDIGFQVVKTLFTTYAVGFIVYDLVSAPTWETVCTVALKVVTVAMTGYTGYKAGFRNITVDTVAYMHDQIDLLEQFKTSEAQEHEQSKANSTNQE